MAKKQTEQPANQDASAGRVRWLVEEHYEGNRSALAAAVGVSHTAISDIVSGKKSPGRKLLTAIATRLNVSSAWLLTGEGAPFVGSASGPPKGLPISQNLLPGSPRDCPALLSGRWLDDTGKLLTPSQYWLMLDSSHRVFRNTQFGFREGDKLLIETSPSQFPDKDVMYDRLCVIQLPKEEKGKLVLGLVKYTPDSRDSREKLSAYLFVERNYESSEWIKEDIYRTMPGGRIEHIERSSPDFVGYGPDPEIKYTDIVGVWTGIIRR